MSEPVRVLVVDDHPVFREGFAALLTSMDQMTVVGTAGDGQQALDAVERIGPDGIDVVVMDIQMPVLDGVEATRRLLARHPGIGVVVLTMSEEDSTVLDAVQAGARGYLLKGAEPHEIGRAIGTVAGGGLVFGSVLAARVIDFFAAVSASARSPFPELTAREEQVLDLVAAGLANQQIADRLHLSPKTVRNHVSAVLTKLRAVDRAEAIVRGRDAGLGRHARH
ncbi:MAG TPA: response regulator transcription factor [Nocardioides sp.]|nr:response regulator transcription factor [Nocardioides sp.]